jgi:hypothetical protein
MARFSSGHHAVQWLIRFGFLALLICPLRPNLTVANPWHHPMALDGGDYWRARLPVTIRNLGEKPLNGLPLALSIDQQQSTAALIGQPAQQIRLTNAEGTEMLFAILGVDGKSMRSERIPNQATLVLPATCAANSAATYYVYFKNPRAGLVPDYLKARPGLVNGSVEQVHGESPIGWEIDEPDEQHRVLWSRENPHSGQRCWKTVVAPDAEPTWIAARQAGIHLVGGARYRVEAWVRGSNVQGRAGWYLHIGNQQDAMLSAPVLSAGDGTFDWKKVTHEFTAPAHASLMSVGTVLRGSGTAWFDDVSLTCLESGNVQVESLPAESCQLKELGEAANGVPWAERLPDRCAVMHVYNFSDRPASAANVCVDLERLRARARGRLDETSIQVRLGDQQVSHTFSANMLLFPAQMPALSAAHYRLYFSDEGTKPEDQESHVASTELTNLVSNGSFEMGRPLPAEWETTGTPQENDGVRFSLDHPGRKDLGAACVRIDVAAGLRESWRGWRQTVPVQGGGTYLLSAWLKCRDLVGGDASVHVHFRRADGKLSKSGGMTSLSQSISGTTDWTLASGLFTVPADATLFQIHLTTTAAGILWHDEISLSKVAPGRISSFACRPMPLGETVAVWQVPSVEKVFPDDPAVIDGQPLRISVAGNERESLQLAIRHGQSHGQVRVRVEPPVNAQQQALPAPAVHVVGYVPIDYPTSYYRSDAPAWQRLVPAQRPQCDGWPGLWPDPLLPTDRFDLQPNTTRSIWLIFDVPHDAPAGDYRGRLRFESDGAVLAQREYSVHVWDFSLPDENHVAAIYDVRFGRGGARHWNRSLEEAYPEIVRFLAERRLSADKIQPAPRIRYVDGRVEADFSEFDRAAEFYFDQLGLPFSYTPWTFYLFGWGHPAKTFFGERPFAGESPYEGVDRSQLRPEYRRAYQACLKVFWDHVKEKGWSDRIVLYISDEPHYQHEHILTQMKTLCEMIHEVDPAIPIYSSTWKHVSEWDGFLDVWGIGHYGRVAVKKMEELKRAGDRIWFTTDGQMCTDTPYCAVERLLPHYCFKYGAEAYEFWGVSWLTYDPYQFGWHSYIRQSSEPGEYYWIRYPNGDGFLIYPGAPWGRTEPVSSVRLENAREGVEDYEYLYRLRQLVAAAKTNGGDVSSAERALAASAELVQVPNAGGRYSSKILPDPGALFRARRNVAEAIEALSD